MRLTIKDKNKNVLGVWVSKTKKGFNKVQLKEQEKARTSQGGFVRSCGMTWGTIS